ncbi:MAG: hypothetical protein ACTSRG_10400 [Candidatus Helarchaeota archaeon]
MSDPGEGKPTSGEPKKEKPEGGEPKAETPTEEKPKRELTEEEKRKQLEERRKELEETRKRLVKEAEDFETSQNYSEAIRVYTQLSRISEELGEKDRVRIFEDKTKELRKKETATIKAAEIEKRREELESNRDQLMENAEMDVNQGKFDSAIAKFKEIAKISQELGETEVADDYTARAKEMTEKKAELIRRFDFEQKVKQLEVQRRDILRKAEESVAKEDYLSASEFYEQASAMSSVMAQEERAEIFLERSKEMREIYEDIRRREEEERARAEMERLRIDLEDKRAKSLTLAESALEKGKFSKAARAYEDAAKFSLDLGEKQVATGFTAQARDIREKEPELRKEFREEKRRVKIRRKRGMLLKKADSFLEREEYLEASGIFLRCAELSKDAGETDRAKEFTVRADECRTKEKEKRDELLDRVAKALRAVITLRLMEPEIASEVFSWEELTTVVKVWDIGSCTITFKEGEATITRGEAAKSDMVIEGTSENLMKFASGRFNHATWAKYMGKIRTHGGKKDTEKIEKILKLPPLERDIEKVYNYTALLVGICALGLVLFVFILLNPFRTIGLFDFIKNFMNLIRAGTTLTNIQTLMIWNSLSEDAKNAFILANFVLKNDLTSLLYSVVNLLSGPVVLLLIYLPGAILALILIPYYGIRRVRFEGVKKKKTKERKRIVRRAIVSHAEKAYKSGRFTEASRLWQKAALISVELADEDRAAEYAVRAHALKGKTAELKKKLKIEHRKELEDKMRKEMASRRSTLETERKKILDEAAQAEDDGRLLDAARHYKLASQLSLEIGEKEKARELSNKAKESKRREAELRKRSKVEKERLKAAERIEKFEVQLKEALEIAEVAIGEERWDDGAKYYNIAAKYAKEMGENERSKAFKAKAEELAKKAELEGKRTNLEEQRRKVIIEAEAASADGNYELASKYYDQASKLSEELGEKEISEGFRATAAELRKQLKKK